MNGIFQSVAVQMMAGDTIKLDSQPIRVRRTNSQRLKTVTFLVDGEEYTAIEQNPDKPSRWGQLARGGHKVVQFKHVASNRFIAVSVDGEVREYRKRS